MQFWGRRVATGRGDCNGQHCTFREGGAQVRGTKHGYHGKHYYCHIDRRRRARSRRDGLWLLARAIDLLHAKPGATPIGVAKLGVERTAGRDWHIGVRARGK